MLLFVEVSGLGNLVLLRGEQECADAGRSHRHVTFQAVHAAEPADRLTQHLGRAGLRLHFALSQHFPKLWDVRAGVGEHRRGRIEACRMWGEDQRKGAVSCNIREPRPFRFFSFLKVLLNYS